MFYVSADSRYEKENEQVLKSMQGIIFDIKRFAIHDGPGIRTTVFFKGCPMDCHWCHNPESRSAEPQKAGNNEIIGKQVTVEEVMKEIEKEVIFYDQSGGGVTFSGGEPLFQPEFLGKLLEECRLRDIHTTLDTTGFAPPDVFASIIDAVDLFLYDLKIMDEEAHILYTGVSNQPVIENIAALSRGKKNVIIRFPVIIGITDSTKNIEAVGAFAASLGNINELHLLPYHQTAGAKYHRLGMQNRMKGVQPPTAEQIERVKHLFESCSGNIAIRKE
jgi:pyruvate formate lyase activating enzyme